MIPLECKTLRRTNIIACNLKTNNLQICDKLTDCHGNPIDFGGILILQSPAIGQNRNNR